MRRDGIPKNMPTRAATKPPPSIAMSQWVPGNSRRMTAAVYAPTDMNAACPTEICPV